MNAFYNEGLRSFDEVNYPEYKKRYPSGVDLKPGSETHDNLATHIRNLARVSYDQAKKRFDSWRRIDETLTTYIPLSESEKIIKDQDTRKPVSIVVPVTYATLETLLTYDVAAFLESPIFRYHPGGPEDKVGTMLLQRVIELQVIRSKMALNLHTMWRTSKAHGVAAAIVGWREVQRFRKLARPDQTGLGIDDLSLSSYGHGTLLNIDSYNYLPDPHVPPEEVQNSEFVGYRDRTNYTAKLREEQSDENIFNVKYLRHLYDARSKVFNEDDSGRYYKTGGKPDDITHSRLIDDIVMYVDLIPSEWGLGKSDSPEYWFFTLSGDSVITTAMPTNLYHGMLPVVTCVPNYDGATLHPTSILETVYGLQGVIDWKFSAQIANVRKALHDMFIVDPELINVNDLKRPGPGKIIKLKRSAWGRGLKDIIMQFPVADVTRQHIQDLPYIKSIVDEVSAASDLLKGARRQSGERVTATEIQGTANGALSRLEHRAKIAALQAHYDIALMMASNTQQFMADEQYIEMVGRMPEDLIDEYGLMDKLQDGFYKVNPKDLAVDFDIVPHDGTIPGSNDTQAWIQIYQILATQPQIGGLFDMVRIFKHIAREMGARNVNDFVLQGGNIQASVQPEETIEEQARQGNLVPTEEFIK